MLFELVTSLQEPPRRIGRVKLDYYIQVLTLPTRSPDGIGLIQRRNGGDVAFEY
jgi:hypothetical protein